MFVQWFLLFLPGGERRHIQTNYINQLLKASDGPRRWSSAHHSPFDPSHVTSARSERRQTLEGSLITCRAEHLQTACCVFQAVCCDQTVSGMFGLMKFRCPKPQNSVNGGRFCCDCCDSKVEKEDWTRPAWGIEVFWRDRKVIHHDCSNAPKCDLNYITCLEYPFSCWLPIFNSSTTLQLLWAQSFRICSVHKSPR